MRNEEDWHALLYETEVCAATTLHALGRSPTMRHHYTRRALGQGLVDPKLLYTAIDWLQRDRPQF